MRWFFMKSRKELEEEIKTKNDVKNNRNLISKLIGKARRSRASRKKTSKRKLVRKSKKCRSRTKKSKN